MANCIQPCSNVNINKMFIACFVYTPLLNTKKKKKKRIHPEICARSLRHNSSQSFSSSAAAAFQYKPLQWVNADILEHLLLHHPDRAEVQYVVDGFRHGFDLGLTRSPKPRGPVRNLRKARHHPEVAQRMIDEEVAKGHMLGPFTEPPFPNMVFSPINLVPKAGSDDKFRLIHDLSYPYNKESMNSCIPETGNSLFSPVYKAR